MKESIPSSSSSSSATKTSQNNFEKSLESAISRTDDQQDLSSTNTGPEGRMWEREEVEVEVVSVSEAEVVSEVEELGLEVVVEVAQEEEGQWC